MSGRISINCELFVRKSGGAAPRRRRRRGDAGEARDDGAPRNTGRAHLQPETDGAPPVSVEFVLPQFFPNKIFPDEDARPAQAGLGGRQRHAEALADLGHGQLLEVAQHDDFEIVGRQGFEREDQLHAQLVIRPNRQPRLDARVGQILMGEHPARQPLALAADDDEQPSGEGGGGLQRPHMAGDDEQRLLHGVVDLAGGAMAQGVAANVAPALDQKPVERQGVPVLGAEDQILSVRRHRHCSAVSSEACVRRGRRPGRSRGRRSSRPSLPWRR